MINFKDDWKIYIRTDALHNWTLFRIKDANGKVLLEETNLKNLKEYQKVFGPKLKEHIESQ